VKKHAHAGLTLAADDPRIGEWIAGRLDATEAAAVAAAVAASADLTRVVAELRAARNAPGASNGGPGDPDDAAIEGEWRKIEAERIAEEREEAREDLLTPEPSRRRWPWLAFAGALAAGVIAALVLNSPKAVSRRMAASRSPDPAARDATPAEPSRQAWAVPDPSEEISVIVVGPEGRRILASLLGEADAERPDGPDGDEQVRGPGVGEFGTTLEDDRLEIVADSDTLGRFLAALADQPTDSPLRLAGPRPPAQPGLGRVVLRLVVDDLPGSTAGPTPESLEE
jgi:hypothetical protein